MGVIRAPITGTRVARLAIVHAVTDASVIMVTNSADRTKNGALPATLHAGVYRIASADLARYRVHGRGLPPKRVAPDPPRPILLPARPGVTIPPLPRPLAPLIGRESE